MVMRDCKCYTRRHGKDGVTLWGIKVVKSCGIKVVKSCGIKVVKSAGEDKQEQCKIVTRKYFGMRDNREVF